MTDKSWERGWEGSRFLIEKCEREHELVCRKDCQDCESTESIQSSEGNKDLWSPKLCGFLSGT